MQTPKLKRKLTKKSSPDGDKAILVGGREREIASVRSQGSDCGAKKCNEN